MATKDYLRELDSIRVDYPLDKHRETGRENTHGPEITAGDLVGGQFNNGLNQKLENLRAEAKGNYSAAQRLVGLEGASVFDDLDNDEIHRVNPLAARAKEKADNQYAAAEAITKHVDRNQPPRRWRTLRLNCRTATATSSDLSHWPRIGGRRAGLQSVNARMATSSLTNSPSSIGRTLSWGSH